MTDLPTRLRERMLAKGFTQASLARAAKLNETAVRDILVGRVRRPLCTTVIALAGALECAPGDLLEDWKPSERDELLAALRCAERDLAATYDALCEGTPVVTLGQWGRLESIRKTIKTVAAP